MNILIAEDEIDIRRLLELHLIKEEYNVFQAEDGLKALELFEREEIHMAILDVMMPELDGYTVLKQIREKSEIPVMFITARGDEQDKILGLGLGADDYILKPFSPIEVVARIQAHLRRYYKYTSAKHSNRISIGDIVLDKESYTVYKNNERLELNAKEYKILELMISNVGKVYTKKQLYETVWEDTYYGDDNTIMVHISHLREKIESNPKEPRYLSTIRGIGYRFERG